MPDINMQVFEEAKRNQLVTEIDIQTQVALDDYQVQLSDIANPTQSQDNVVIDRNGEFLPHWNESLDFDTWVKISMELAGEKLLMIHGNAGLISESDGNDVFIFFDDFDDDSLTGWSGDTASFTESGGYISCGVLGKAIYPTGITVSNHSVDTQLKLDTGARGHIGFRRTWNPVYQSTLMLGYDINMRYPQSDLRMRECVTEGVAPAILDSTGYSYDTAWHNVSIKGDGSSLKAYYDSTELSATDSSQTNGVAEVATDTIDSGNVYCDNYRIRKYVVTEPTVIACIPKNISTVLKSLGRAG